MELWKCISIFILAIFGSTRAQDFYVVAPSSLQLNYDQNIAIGVDSESTVTANIKIQDYPRRIKTIFEKNVEIKQGEPILVKVNLDVTKFPQGFLNGSKEQKQVYLNVQVKNSQKEVTIPISTEAGYMFIQSDKPVYNPLERANFRIIPLTEEGLPSREKFKLEIRNPHNIIVDEKVFNDRKKLLDFYMASHSYTFPKKFPTLGEWKVVVHYGHNLERNSSITFELKEYVLPTFTLKLETPNVILESAQTITIGLYAKHVYGKKVKGVVVFRIGIKKEHSPIVTYVMVVNPRVLSDEIPHKVRIPTKDLKAHKEVGWFPEGSYLVVEATVVDDATGNKMVEVDSSTRFSKTPFLISFKRCLTDFRPGLPSVFEADITHADGKPAEGIPTKIIAVADNGQNLNINKKAPVSNKNGKVAFELHPQIHHKQITLTLETDDPNPNYVGRQAKGTFVQYAYQSKNNAYIAISRSTPLRIQPGDTFSRYVHFEPKGIKYIYYMVLTKGRILFIGKLPEGDFKVHRMEFQITYDMVPNFRVVVFAHHGGDFIADSLKIDVENICHPRTEVTIETEFTVKAPASTGKIIIRGTKDTSVGLLGVDEAVYALSRKELLSREKMFNTLASHDLGCGPGGGVDINTVLGNAGVVIATNKFTPSLAHTCGEIKRRKRSIAKDIVGNYTGDDRVCCGLGLKAYKNTGSCDEKYEAGKKDLENMHQNCSEIFLECCEEGVKHNVTGFVVVSSRIAGDPFDDVDFLLDPDLDNFETQTTIRKDFREILVYENYLIGSENKFEFNISLPHSITTWVIQAVSVNPQHGICVAKSERLESFMPVFMHVNIPYSVKLYEQLDVEVTVFNYGNVEQKALIYMAGEKDLCSSAQPGNRTEIKRISVKPMSAETFIFPVIPLQVKIIPIKFYLRSFNTASDIVEKNLNVVPQGIPESEEVVVKLDPANRQKRVKRHVETKLYSDFINPKEKLQVTALNVTLPNDTVPGTAICSIACTGDLIGPAIESTINNPDSLIKKPHGCGEQNLVNLAPTVYTMRYLKSANKLTPEQSAKGTEFIRFGYDNELKFKKNDGSYSVWANTPTSTWLTAFVVKVFCQAAEFTPIDPAVISSGLNWLVRNQQPDGSYIEKNRIYHREMMGGVDGTVSMTAFALIALQECKNEEKGVQNARQKAVAYLEAHVATTHSPLPAAVVAYALALSNSEVKQVANDRLMSMASRSEAYNHLYWRTENSARDIETAGYGLLTQLVFNDIINSSSIVNWLNTKQLKSGEFKSTQDTVIALQALSEYAINEKTPAVNLLANITMSHDKNFYKTIYINEANALQVQEVNIEDPDGLIFVNTAGYGMGTLSVRCRYNVQQENEICKFDINVNTEPIQLLNAKIKGVTNAIDKGAAQRQKRNIRDEFPDLPDHPLGPEMLSRIKRNGEKENREYALKTHICVKHLGNKDTEMSIVDVGIFSGFEPSDRSLEELVNDKKHLIQRYENHNRKIVFYLDRIPSADFYCFSFDVHRKFIVGNVQASIIKVYDYYNPDETCTKFYGPDKESALLKKDCINGVCTCAEGGCAPENPFKDHKIEDRAESRYALGLMLCEKFDYVWRVKIVGRMSKRDGFYNITVRIEDVIKPGIESKDTLEGKTRSVKTRDHCSLAKIFVGAEYLLMGKDPPERREKDNSAPYYLYYLSDTSIIYPWSSIKNDVDDDLKYDLEYVTYELQANGCDL